MFGEHSNEKDVSLAVNWNDKDSMLCIKVEYISVYFGNLEIEKILD
jgi:hypothetical protein